MHPSTSPTIKDLRLRQGLSQAALAERMGVQRSYIGAIETGYGIGPSTIQKLADALGVSTADIYEAAEATRALHAPESTEGAAS